MSESEAKTAYEQFLEQAQEEVVHHEQPTKNNDNFLRYRDIANELFSIAKRESLPFLNNRFQLLSAIAVVLALLGHIVLFLNYGSAGSSLRTGQKTAESEIESLSGLTGSQRKSYKEETAVGLSEAEKKIAQKSFFLQMVLGVGTALIAFSGFQVCRRVAQRNSDKNIFSCAAAATHNFLLWKLRSPSNATTYSVFVDFDQLESDDIDFGQLKNMFANAHHSWNRRGFFDFLLIPIFALPVFFIPNFGLGIYIWTIAFGFALAIRRHLTFVGPYDCLNHLPSPIAAPYPQNQMPKSDGQDGYPG